MTPSNWTLLGIGLYSLGMLYMVLKLGGKRSKLKNWDDFDEPLYKILFWFIFVWRT